MFAFDLLEGETLAAVGVGLLVVCVAYLSISLGVARGKRVAASARSPFTAESASPPRTPASGPITDPFAHGGMSERRRSIRRAGNPVPVLISDAGRGQPARRGAVVDRSQGGLRLLVDGPAKRGQVISVRAEAADPMVPWMVMQVRHCQRTSVGWEWGCQFRSDVPANVMWLFG